MKQLMAGGGVALIGMQLIPMLANLFNTTSDAIYGTVTSVCAMVSPEVAERAAALTCEAAPKITEVVTILPLHLFVR